MLCYKSINKYFNGTFAVTDRGSVDFYGTTVQRTQPMTREHIFVILASVPGEGVVKYIFGEEKGIYTPGRFPSGIGQAKVNEIKHSGISKDAINDTLVLLSKRKILENPFQYVIFTSIEGLKMFFWESTQVGYVIYPNILTKLFVWMPFKNGLRLGVSLLTLSAFAYLFVLLWRDRKSVLSRDNSILLIYLSYLFIFSFISVYSLFVIITRYALPIAPLYIILIIYAIQSCFAFRIKNMFGGV